MIIDCHGHFNTQKDLIKNAKKYLTDETARRAYGFWARGPNKAEEQTTVEAWIDSLDRYGVDKVLLQTAPFGSSDAVAEFQKKAPDRFVGLANIDFIDPEGSNSVREVERCVKELKLKGIGELYPQMGPWDPGDKKYFPIYEKAEELGVPIMIHGGIEPFPAAFNHQQYGDPYMLDPALRAFPDLPFIVCHMGGDLVHRLFTLMICRHNLYAEISSFTTHIPTPHAGMFNVTPQQVMKRFVEVGFADRLLWATDVQAPYFSEMLKNSVQGETIKDNYVVKVLNELKVSEQDKAKILGENAKRLFKL